jgi:hypothetical protein
MTPERWQQIERAGSDLMREPPLGLQGRLYGEVTLPARAGGGRSDTYDASGRMSVQIMQPGGPNFPGIDPLDGTLEEMVTAY